LVSEIIRTVMSTCSGVWIMKVNTRLWEALK